MPDPTSADTRPLDLEAIKKRYRGWIPIAEWGPKCAGCGDDEYRIDGYCSVECRDFHSDDDVEALVAEVERLREALERIVSLTVIQPGSKPGIPLSTIFAAAALAPQPKGAQS